MTERGTVTELDYAVGSCIDIDSRDALVDAFRAHEHQPVRLLGSGTAQRRLPTPDGEPTLLRLAELRGIERLEPDDLTCSVAPGTPRVELDEALAAANLWLPCAGAGTIGGMFAADLRAPLAPGGYSARSLLLGLEGVLSDGTPFKSGARVVKSVAGFDLQKLYVGSRGRLFAATLLHLKLRQRPRTMRPFCRGDLEQDEALALFRALRSERDALFELWLEGSSGGFAVRGCTAGHPRHLDAVHRRHALADADSGGRQQLEPTAELEVVAGLVLPSRLPELLAVLPDGGAVLVSGTGQLEALLAPEQSDALAASSEGVPAAIEVRAGRPERRGSGTPTDIHTARLEEAIRTALDPAGVLR